MGIFFSPPKKGGKGGGGSNNPKKETPKTGHFWEEKNVYFDTNFAQVRWLFLILTHMFVERLSYSYSNITRMSVYLSFFRDFGIFQVSVVDKSAVR